jgi:beta-lactamase class A
MRRAAVLAAAATAVMVHPRGVRRPAAAARAVDVGTLVARFPGQVGIYARTLAQEPPAVAVRDTETFPAASVIKLAIMLAAYRAFDAGTASLDDRVALRAADLIGGSPVFSAAIPGERYALRTLLAAAIRESDNTAANALITTFGFAAINAAIAEAGMSSTRLQRHFAAIVEPWRHNLNVSTPRDTGTLLYAIERGAHEGIDTVARATSCRAMVELMLGQAYRDMIPAGIPRGVPVANKTGELDDERNDAAIVDPFGDNPYLLVVFARRISGDGATRAAIAGIARRIDGVLRAG